MSWSATYDFAITGEKQVLDNIRNFFEGIPVSSNLIGYDLIEVRKALYGEKMQETGSRVICGGDGTVLYHIDKNGIIHVVVDAYKNYLEYKRFIKALRKKTGKFRYAVLIDNTELFQDKTAWTSDRTGNFFPHFVLLEGTPEELSRFPVIYTETVKDTPVRNSTELLKELRKRGYRFRSFKELIARYKNLAIKDEKGNTVLGVWSISSPGQTIPGPYACDA